MKLRIEKVRQLTEHLSENKYTKLNELFLKILITDLHKIIGILKPFPRKC